MEPRKIEKPVESRGEGQTAPPRQTERKRRFQIVQLEERIAPNKGGISPHDGQFGFGGQVG
jgi:hypothetical protein